MNFKGLKALLPMEFVRVLEGIFKMLAVRKNGQVDFAFGGFLHNKAC